VTATLLTDLTDVITYAARGAERSQQTSVGPSEIGGSCERRLAMGLLGAPKPNDSRDEWTSSVGTACHSWMEEAFAADNARRVKAGLPQRWLIEQTVSIRTGLDGHCDLYDLATHTVIDHKFPGVTSIKKYRKQGHPGQQYRWQLHLYGRGWANLGMPIANVMLITWPRSGRVQDAWQWGEPYSDAVADEALGRVDKLLTAMDVAEGMGELETMLDMLDRDTEHCGWCAYFDANATDPSKGCKGAFADPDYADPRLQTVSGII
jgi:hypothetical protein